MKTSIKATILAVILATGIGGATCGGFITLNVANSKDIMTNCQYNNLKTSLFTKYPTSKEIIEIDDWQLLVAVINKEINKKGKLVITESNQINVLEKIMSEIK